MPGKYVQEEHIGKRKNRWGPGMPDEQTRRPEALEWGEQGKVTGSENRKAMKPDQLGP